MILLEECETRRNDLSAWFNFGPSTSSWTKGPVAAPLIYSETIVPANSDIAMGGAQFATKTENKSLGFNAAWRVSNDLKLGCVVVSPVYGNDYSSFCRK